MCDGGNCWPEQDAVEDWFIKHKHELKESVSQYRINIQVKIQKCLDCGKEYIADSHEYPCPWCIIKKKLDIMDKAYMRLYGSTSEGMDSRAEEAMIEAMHILNEGREAKCSCEDEQKIE